MWVAMGWPGSASAPTEAPRVTKEWPRGHQPEGDWRRVVVHRMRSMVDVVKQHAVAVPEASMPRDQVCCAQLHVIQGIEFL